MTTASWFLLSLLFWLGGFFNMYLLEPNPQSRLVSVPNWMLLLFKELRPKNVPSAVQTVLGIYLQMMGMTLAFYGIFLDQRLVHDPDLSGLLGFGISMLLGITISRLF